MYTYQLNEYLTKCTKIFKWFIYKPIVKQFFHKYVKFSYFHININ